REVGVVHVMQGLAYNAARLPWRNAVLQFAGATAAIVTGHSVGREGPAIHVGAATASMLGQWLHLPNDSVRILVACGTAAAIAASLDTPIAGVVFAMEVVMMEYSLVGFTPVILAAVCATSMTHLVFGSTPFVEARAMQMTSLLELPCMLLVGVVLGTLASLFIASVRRLFAWARAHPLWLRTTAAGLVTGLCALAAPQIMGVGYDTVELTLVGGLGLSALVMIVSLKLVATTACIGLGIPGGLIGPTVLMGALGGAAHASAALTVEHGQGCVSIPTGATLREALDAMDRAEVDVAVITGPSIRDANTIKGVLRRAEIEAAVRHHG
ncbi:MAG: hypothetical protein GWN21_16175, partial [Gammaproteobacteria bacterium]|nr:chloride channel protein [Gammaproteobacteria bacterium]NIP90299.1 chloride channel protein [Gammaproteobacteria bacterium]NIR22226.1 chloride channel protein [Gammaproteobacteria bacterium]NIS03864.1 chloride channel protein [Gammaproteobacteria bacterium]NIU42307.1 hypothetical protein [Gammaproteobacteria bacterium]